MPNEYPTILHQWFDEVWNQQKTDTIDKMMSDDTLHYGLTGPGGGPISGIANFKEFHATFRAAFPDIRVTLHDVVVVGDKIAARYTVNATHQGYLNGMPPTDAEVEFTGAGMCTVADGKFVEVWNEIDFGKMYYDLENNKKNFV
ncbi:MAG: ester cyclase [Pyrinomonadaceae bacterium]